VFGLTKIIVSQHAGFKIDVRKDIEIAAAGTVPPQEYAFAMEFDA